MQNLTFRNGRSVGRGTEDGGGAIFVRGGRLKVVDSRFFGDRCAPTGPDVAGGAIQVFSQYQGLPVYVVNSTFGGPDGKGNHCSNGEGESGIFFVSDDRSGDVRIVSSVLRRNHGDGFKTHPGIFFLGRRISFAKTVVR